jgi:hypothetical protein
MRSSTVKGIEVDMLNGLGKLGARLVAEAFRYTHLTGLSSESHRERNRELLVVARRSGK